MLEVRLKGTPNEDFIQGYPGIPATWPRLAGTVEVRIHGPDSKVKVNNSADIKKVTVALFRTDSIVVPSHRPAMASQKREKSFLVTRQKEIYRASAHDTSKVYALDVPFTLSLPTQLTASISLSKTLESIYHALVSVSLVDPVSLSVVTENYQFPIRLRKFDTLATFGAFSQPLKNEKVSSDHMVSLEWALPISAFGPGDLISISVRTPPNTDWPKSKKVKLKRVSMELVQITKYMIPKEEGEAARSESAGDHAPEEEEIETRTRLAKVGRDFTSADQSKRRGLDEFENLELPVPSLLRPTDSKILPKEFPEVGFEGRTPFTNTSSLYSIDFELVLHARFSNAKDIEARQAITMSQFGHTICSTYMHNIVETAQKLRRMSHRGKAPSIWVEPLDTRVKIG